MRSPAWLRVLHVDDEAQPVILGEQSDHSALAVKFAASLIVSTGCVSGSDIALQPSTLRYRERSQMSADDVSLSFSAASERVPDVLVRDAVGQRGVDAIAADEADRQRVGSLSVRPCDEFDEVEHVGGFELIFALRGCIGADASGGNREGCKHRDDVQKAIHVDRNFGPGFVRRRALDTHATIVRESSAACARRSATRISLCCICEAPAGRLRRSLMRRARRRAEDRNIRLRRLVMRTNSLQ